MPITQFAQAPNTDHEISRHIVSEGAARLARGTIAICSAWNQFLKDSASQPHLDSNTKPT
jgi:hypothetical protein